MHRGVLELPKESIGILVAIGITSPLLIKKIESAAQSPTELTTLELSEDEAEYLLDYLPIPSFVEPVAVSELRHRLQQFIENLRA